MQEARKLEPCPVACSTTRVRCCAPPASAGATQRQVAERAGSSTATISRLENGLALPSDPLIDGILDAYSAVTGVPRLELLERATADWQRDDCGEVRGL
jgi:transcriptional regulator with XRE-family HTH domain